MAGVAGFIVSFPLQEQIFPAIKADLVNGVVYEAYMVARIAVILLYSYRMTSILFTVVRIRVHTHY